MRRTPQTQMPEPEKPGAALWSGCEIAQISVWPNTHPDQSTAATVLFHQEDSSGTIKKHNGLQQYQPFVAPEAELLRNYRSVSYQVTCKSHSPQPTKTDDGNTGFLQIAERRRESQCVTSINKNTRDCRGHGCLCFLLSQQNRRHLSQGMECVLQGKSLIDANASTPK